MPASWERGPWEAESEQRGVYDGTDTGIMGAGVAGAESGWHGICDGAGIVGVGAMRG